MILGVLIDRLAALDWRLAAVVCDAAERARECESGQGCAARIALDREQVDYFVVVDRFVGFVEVSCRPAGSAVWSEPVTWWPGETASELVEQLEVQ